MASDYLVDGKVLGVRSLRADFTSYNNFANPTEVGAEVFAPDWKEEAECGNGLHFVPWGLGHEGQDLGVMRPVWQVVEPIGVVIDLGGKCKSHGLRILHTGTLAECMALTHEGRIAFSSARANGQEKSTGDRSSAASTGYSSSAASTGDSSSAASTGNCSSAASTGYRSSAASTGDRSSAASTGDRSSAASTGYRSSAASTGDSSSAASTGNCSVAVVTGISSRARAGSFGCVALAFRVLKGNDFVRDEMRCARVGCGDGSDGLLKADTWYSLDETGDFVEIVEVANV